MKHQKKSSDSTSDGAIRKRDRESVPGENLYMTEVKQLRKTIPHWKNMYSKQADETRQDELLRLRILGQPLAEKYSWAIPDERSLNVLKHFSPLIEIGCGKGYWASLLQERGVDIIPIDQEGFDDAWTKITLGNPDSLSKSIAKGRNLFLCYPDEAESMAIECLKRFTGDYIIHVGELIHFGSLAVRKLIIDSNSMKRIQLFTLSLLLCEIV